MLLVLERRGLSLPQLALQLVVKHRPVQEPEHHGQQQQRLENPLLFPGAHPVAHVPGGVPRAPARHGSAAGGRRRHRRPREEQEEEEKEKEEGKEGRRRRGRPSVSAPGHGRGARGGLSGAGSSGAHAGDAPCPCGRVPVPAAGEGCGPGLRGTKADPGPALTCPRSAAAPPPRDP